MNRRIGEVPFASAYFVKLWIAAVAGAIELSGCRNYKIPLAPADYLKVTRAMVGGIAQGKR